MTTENLPVEALEWYQKNLDYNIPYGKCVRGTFLVDAIEILQHFPLTEEEYQRAAVLVSSFLSDVRRHYGQFPYVSRTCLLVPNKQVGMIAINDAFMIEAAIFRLLRMHLGSEAYYVDVVDLFHELVHMTEIGQMLDLITAPRDVVDLDKFSLKRQIMISEYKAAYAYYYPVAIALVVTGTPPPSSFTSKSSTNPYELAKSILLPIGIYYQDQDDFLNFAGTPEVFGKVGSDIVDNKRSLCIVTALSLLSAKQRKVLDENYRGRSADCEKRVRKVFEEIELRKVYKEYEEAAVSEIKERIGGISVEGMGLKKEIFDTLLDKIYKRTK